MVFQKLVFLAFILWAKATSDSDLDFIVEKDGLISLDYYPF